MAAVRIEEEAFADERYADLAAAAGLSDSDHARGKMIRIWRQCTIEQSHQLPRVVVDRILGPGGAEALQASRLGEVVGDVVRIRGTSGRIEWLQRLRDNGKHGKAGGRPKETLKGLPDETLKGVVDQTPLAITTALALAKEEESVSGKPDPGLAFANKAISLINRHAGTKYQPDSAAVLKLVNALIKNRHTPEQAERVIASKRAWIGDPKMGQFFRPATLLAATNFANYLSDLEAGATTTTQGPGQQYQQSTDREDAVSPLMLAFSDDAP